MSFNLKNDAEGTFEVKATVEAECGSCGSETVESWHFATPAPRGTTYWFDALKKFVREFDEVPVDLDNLNRIVIERVS